MKKYLLAVAAVVGLAGTANAASFNLIVEGGGTQQVFALNNGNFLGLWGIDNRPSGASNVTVSSQADLISGFTPGSVGNIVNVFNGTNPINGGASEFDQLTYSFTVNAGERLFDSLWIEWTGGNLVYQKQLGRGTTTMNSNNITRQGDPLAAAVPLPAAGWMLIAGVAGLFAVRRRKSA